MNEEFPHFRGFSGTVSDINGSGGASIESEQDPCEKWGIIDEAGRWIAEPLFDHARAPSMGMVRGLRLAVVVVEAE